MNYYMFKQTMDKQQALDPVVIMKFCEHCDSKIWGIWELPNLQNDFGWNYPSSLAKKCLHYGTDKVREDVYSHYSYLDIGTKRDSKGNLKSYSKTVIHPDKKDEYDKCIKIIKSLTSSKIDQYHNELISFLETNTCPICGKTLNTHNYIFETITYCPEIMGQYGVKSVWHEGHFTEKELENVDLEGIKLGEKIKTKNGIGKYIGKDKNGEYKFDYYQNSSYESIIDFVEENHKYICSQKCTDRYNKIANTSVETNIPSYSPDIKLKITQENLKEYLLNVINIEKNIFCLSERLKELYVQEKIYEIEENATLLHSLYRLRIEETSLKEECNTQIETASKINVTARNFPYEKPVKPQCPDKPQITKPAQPILQTPGLFNKKKVLAENELVLQDYEKKLSKYNEILETYNSAVHEYESKLKEYNSEIERLKKEQEEKIQEEIEKAKKDNEEKCIAIRENYNKQISELKTKISHVKKSISPEALVLQEIKDEIVSAEKLFTEALRAREKLYSLNVVFGKYRDFVAVSSFYEYLISGRCTTLEGADGAYNLYENELRMNLIISQLSSVIKLLEEIRNNQYTIYNAINEVSSEICALNNCLADINSSIGDLHAQQIDTNNILNNINENTEKIKESTENIAYNTAATAFYAKRNTEITNALGFMIALK